MIAGILCGAGIAAAGYVVGYINGYDHAKKTYSSIIDDHLKNTEDTTRSVREFSKALEMARIAIEEESKGPDGKRMRQLN